MLGASNTGLTPELLENSDLRDSGPVHSAYLVPQGVTLRVTRCVSREALGPSRFPWGCGVRPIADGAKERPRRRFADQFKSGVVRMALDERKTLGAVARDMDQTENAKRE